MKAFFFASLIASLVISDQAAIADRDASVIKPLSAPQCETTYMQRAERTEAERWFKRGVERQSKGDLEGAIRAYRLAIESSDCLSNPHWYLAKALQESGKTEEADAENQKAEGIFALPPEHAVVKEKIPREFMTGEALGTDGFPATLSFRSQRARSWFRTGLHRQTEKDLKGAVAAYEAAIATLDFDPDVHWYLATALKESGDTKRANSEFSASKSPPKIDCTDEIELRRYMQRL